MKLKSLAAAIALCSSLPAMAATCTSTFSLGTLGPSDVALFGNTFNRVQSFNDCYNFTLSAVADAVGVTVTWDWSRRLNIDLTSASLTGGHLVDAVTDPSANSFAFSELVAGNYQLALAGNVTATESDSTDWGVGYGGLLTTNRVPEPASLALVGMGLLAAGWGVRRKA